MFSKTLIAAYAAALFASANAHFTIQIPSPIPGSADKSPLDPSGSNFPCQGADVSQGSVTNMAAGSNQPLNFNLGGGANTAVHGGGSCQISLTYETDKTKLKDPSSWKVIHSFVGGCPTNAVGNLDNGPGAVACTGADTTNCVNQNLTFSIPPEAKSGNAILGWTWFNNIGNREMYMNCARVSISGANGNLAGLPNMFTANIGSDCKTVETTNLNFPSPGKYVTMDPKLNYPLHAPQGSACGSGAGSSASSSTGSSSSGSGTSGSGSSGSGTSGSGSSGSGTSGSGTSASSAPSSSPSSKGGNGGSNGGAFAEGSSATSAAAAAPTAAAATAAPVAPASSGSTSGSGSGSGSGSCTGGAVACSASGFYCIDANHFGECAFGCAIPMQMAAGTACTNNAVAHAVSQKRRWNFFSRLF